MDAWSFQNQMIIAAEEWENDNLLNSYNHSTCGYADYQTDPERNKPSQAESGNRKGLVVD